MHPHLDWTTCFAVAGYVVANPPVRAALAFAARLAMRLDWRRLATPALAGMLLLSLFLMGESQAVAQTRRGTGRGGATQATGADPRTTVVVANFQGNLREINKKEFTIELENGNTVEFKIGKKTEFLEGEKAIKPTDLAPDQFLKVEGTKDLFGVITATKVVTAKPKPVEQ